MKTEMIFIPAFPAEDLVVEELPEDARKKLKLLSSLEFIKTGQNVILAGNAGTGKTHIATGLGIKACLEGSFSAHMWLYLEILLTRIIF